MPEQKVLIVTYYWPPSGGSGVQRWLKFAKYLPQFGWTPVIFTPENPALVQQDESLLKDVPAEAKVIRYPIWEPYDAFFKISSILGSKSKVIRPTEFTVAKNSSAFKKVASWIRGNLFVPDPKIFWVRPSAKFLSGYLKQHNIQTIVTTGPPHSMHLIGYKLKKKDPSLNWIADFRDPWSEWSFLDSFDRMTIVRNYHKRLERSILETADHVVTITPYYKNRFEILSGKNVTLLTNGFDEDDFASIQYSRPEKFTIRHVGIVYEMANPMPLIEALTKLSGELVDFKEQCVVEFIGEVNRSYKEAIQNSSIAQLVSFNAPVQHKKLMGLYGTSSVLLLNLDGYQQAEGLAPGKLYEYLATGLPVLGVGPTSGDAAKILNEADAGRLFDPTDVSGFSKALAVQYAAWKEGRTTRYTGNTKRFSRRIITQNLVQLLSARVNK